MLTILPEEIGLPRKEQVLLVRRGAQDQPAVMHRRRQHQEGPHKSPGLTHGRARCMHSGVLDLPARARNRG
jgi:hypothetical protein